MRIGLFGGTFNPVHIGHIQVAKEVKEGFPLDRVVFFPSAIPPHKEKGGVASAQDRVQMLKTAISGIPESGESFIVSEIELKRSGPSYTIDTVRHFQSQADKDQQYYLMMGSDAFFEIDTWKSYDELFQRIPFIVLSRPDENSHSEKDMRKCLEKFIHTRISSDYRYTAGRNYYEHPEKMPIYMFAVTPIDISATRIRSALKNGEPIKSMLPAGVAEYIQSKGLYLND